MTLVCFTTVLSLLATVLLLPVDVALVSSTTNIKLGAKKDWATPDAVDNILLQLKIVYYTLYSLDAVLCLLVVPFTYFWYEEYDEVATEDGTQTFASRLWGAFKYTIVFIAICVILFLVGFFIPVAKQARDDHRDLDYFKYLLTENRTYTYLQIFSVCTNRSTDGERALSFAIGVLITNGTVLCCCSSRRQACVYYPCLILVLHCQYPHMRSPCPSTASSKLCSDHVYRRRKWLCRRSRFSSALVTVCSPKQRQCVRIERFYALGPERWAWRVL